VSAGEPFTDLRDRNAKTVGRRPHVDNERVEGPHPQVIGLPPDHLVQQRRIDTGTDHRRGAQRWA